MNNSVGLIKRFAACLYELLSLVAIWLLCTTVFVLLFGGADTGLKRFSLQMCLWLVTGAYLIICWSTTGQTLAAQAWKVTLVNEQNKPLNIGQAMLRYLLATCSFLGLGLGFLWALIDKEQLFLHDRLLKTRFIKASTNASS